MDVQLRGLVVVRENLQCRGQLFVKVLCKNLENKNYEIVRAKPATSMDVCTKSETAIDLVARLIDQWSAGKCALVLPLDLLLKDLKSGRHNHCYLTILSRQILELSRRYDCVLGLIHEELYCVYPQLETVLKSLANSYYSLSKCDHLAVCHSIVRQVNGKVHAKYNTFGVDSAQLKFTDVKPYTPSTKPKVLSFVPASIPVPAPQPSASASVKEQDQVSFNLSLSSKEKVDKDKVALPHMVDAGIVPTPLVNINPSKPASVARIEYIADENDDLDDSDPDEDLHI